MANLSFPLDNIENLESVSDFSLSLYLILIVHMCMCIITLEVGLAISY